MSKKKKEKAKFNPYWVYGAIVIMILGFQFFGSFGGSSKNIDEYKFFDEILKTNDVKSVLIINNETAKITIKKDALEKEIYSEVRKMPFGDELNLGPHYNFNIVDVQNFKQRFDKEREINNLDVTINSKKEGNWFGGWLGFLLPIAIIYIIISSISKRAMGGGSSSGMGGAGGIFNVGKSKAKVFGKDENVGVTFKDVAGLEGAKEEIEEIVDFLKNSSKYTALGGKIPRGALLVGPPGTGKTLLAKAVAGEAKVPFFSMSGSDFMEMFVGVGASRVRDLFKQAKEKSPCIIFIDEIDAIGRARGKNAVMSSNDERENTLNQLLTEMDGFGTKDNVIILAATNRVDILDNALLRPGRFDRQIYVDLPELKEREAIFKVHTKKLKTNKSLDINFLAKQTPGFSGADIANICNESALIAARKSKKSIGKQEFMDAVDRIVGGLEKKGKVMTEKERKVIACHEAGHATASWMLEHASPLVKVTIVPRGKSLGAAWYLPKERQITTKEQMLDEMCATLAGRAAEEIIFKEVSTGALNDLERVTKQAQAIVTIYGLNDEVGNITYFDSSGQGGYEFNKPYSEKTAEIIDKEISKIVEDQYKRAKDILSKEKKKLENLGELLLEKEVIFKDDLDKLFGKRKFDIEENYKKKTKKKAINSDKKEITKKKTTSTKKEVKEKKTTTVKEEK